MIRSGYGKLIHYYEDGRDELYDLSSDPGERTDLLKGEAATTTEELAGEMRKRIETWLDKVDAKLPVLDPEYDADAEAARLSHLEGDFMQGLEERHAEYLDPEWKPNDDWWGSLVTED